MYLSEGSDKIEFVRYSVVERIWIWRIFESNLINAI